ncbi:hypothetical protein [Legionella oakridgensis]|uniref:Dot/Icm T4SS effector n=2 Tax=Legionella oakridgensis TaxID=29423 RepID=W0BDY7_9GAMM|nr:hypothetical protein [Legionella oakridgensis]AHE68085.1 hypothetical protein Loa_02548 [Legionella oakridgensis ATCC 33761 = DSM 21215]ETO92428.1 hypothetical protein LOR_39c04690 [Legionella oakridgensis RV-2-2007]KTD44525.1 Dot/Icm T4SS effector [Legionella oakridgensis]STY21064.1 Dot/Icm T4SS effector [Legionella longbeachae]
MSFTFRTYDELKARFAENITFLCGYHRAESVENLPPLRRSQIQFLQETITALDTDRTEITPEIKAKILSGAMLVIHNEIEESYRYSDPTQSVLYQKLTETLGISAENSMQAEDRCDSVGKIMKFLHRTVFIGGKSEAGLNIEHPYLKDRPRLAEVWKRGADMIAAASKEMLTRNLAELTAREAREAEEAQAAETAAKGRTSLFGWFAGRSTAPSLEVASTADGATIGVTVEESQRGPT